MSRFVLSKPTMSAGAQSKPAAAKLLAWYDRGARVMPWRMPPAQRRARRADPYHVWLSEVMLQQTTVAAVVPYFRAFVERWPTVEALAAASLDEVLRAWAGLGYYARARNLHACARIVADGHGGRFPDDEAALRQLPGIGAYTAAAIAAIAFDRPATAVDGNVERVVARLFAVAEPLPGAKPELHRLAASLVPADRPGDYTQALMDLGATVCAPKKPRCQACPWRDACRAGALGIAEALPARAPRKPRPLRRGVAYWAVRPDGAVLLRRRPERGLLGGMMEVPSSPWLANGVAAPGEGAPCAAAWWRLPGVVRHTFTHFELELTVVAAGVGAAAGVDGVWVVPDTLGDQALPSLMRKVVRHAYAHV